MTNTPANLEHQHEEVFGKSFALYGKAEMLEFIEPFRVRFERNRLDARHFFEGRRCLDAGCGNGRGAIFMMMHGAASVDCVDISPTNIESTARNLGIFGFNAFRTHLAGLQELPFPNETFDFVWCNGVIMHAADPDACLKELARVLKTGGRSWLYVYGARGLYWWIVRRFRTILSAIEPAAVMASLELMRYPVRYIAEYMDDWKVAYLRTYSAEDLGRRLAELGFENVTPLAYGVDYDTSQRLHENSDERPWMGDGDLRYLLTKVREPAGEANRLSDGPYGSDTKFASIIEERFGRYFDDLAECVAPSPVLAVAACAAIQRNLRRIMSNPGRLDIDAIEAVVQNALKQTRRAAFPMARN